MLKKLFKNFNPEALKKYALNTSWMLMEKVVRIVVSMIIGLLMVVPYLGKEQYGKLEYARSFVMLFSAFAALGLQEIIAREIVKTPDKTHHILGTSFWLKIIGASVIFLIINSLSLLMPEMGTNEWGIGAIAQDNTDKLLIFVSSLMLFFTAFDVINFYFQAKVLSKFVVQMQIVVMLLGGAWKVFGIYREYSLLYFASVITGEFLMMAIGFVWIFHQQKQRIFQWKFDIKIAKKLLKDAYPLMLSMAMIVIYMRIDQIMIKQMLGDGANGNYSVAVRLSEAWYFVPSVISASVFPAILNARAKDNFLYYKRLQQLFDLLVLMGVAVGIIMLFIALPLMDLIGKDFSDAAGVLQIHIWGGVFVALGVASSKWLLAENFTKVSLHRTIVGAVINIIANWVLIPIWDVNGAAWATLISSMCVAYLFDLFHPKTTRIFWMKTKSITGISIVSQLWKLRKQI